MEDDVETDSRVAADGSIIEYRARDHGFSQTEGVALLIFNFCCVKMR
jgi:hypothetical protein